VAGSRVNFTFYLFALIKGAENIFPKIVTKTNNFESFGK
jgi:hypothetical protein